MDNNYRLPTGKEIIFILIAFIVTMFVVVIYFKIANSNCIVTHMVYYYRGWIENRIFI
jgi:hypothetical protein